MQRSGKSCARARAGPMMMMVVGVQMRALSLPGKNQRFPPPAARARKDVYKVLLRLSKQEIVLKRAWASFDFEARRRCLLVAFASSLPPSSTILHGTSSMARGQTS